MVEDKDKRYKAIIEPMSNHIICPRCHNDQTTATTQDIPLGSEVAQIPKQTCNNCRTRFYFEEDIIGFLFQSSNVQNPQIESTTKSPLD